MSGEILNPLLGGMAIGLASALMFLGIGRIAGISGILGTSLTLPQRENLWKYFFILGLILSGFLYKIFQPEALNYEFVGNKLTIILAGFLVGFGTRLGSGCTSGHGVCGLSRLSKRSLVATLIFMGTAITVVLIKGAIL